MSKHPPTGPPPPYDYAYPPAYVAPPVAYTYVPTTMYLPMYTLPPSVAPQPQPPPYATYVTNIYQHSDPRPTAVLPLDKPVFRWVSAKPSTAHFLSHKAVVASEESRRPDKSPLWVIRANYNGDCVPGKLAIKNKAAYIPYAGKEVPVLNFEMLTCKRPDALRWLPSSQGHVPVGAIVAGNTQNGETLYIARASHKGSKIPGKVHPSHRCCYISSEGNMLSFKEYEVLCEVVG